MRLTIADEIDLRVRMKPCKNLLTQVDGDRLVLTENRRSLWLLLFVIGLGISALTYHFLVRPPDDSDAALAAKAYAALFGLPYAVVVLIVCPWNRRVTFDREIETCRIQYRFYVLPFWFRTFCTNAGNIEVTSVIHVTYSNRVPQKPIGDRAFSMMLGTAGKFMDAFETLNSRVQHHNRYLALVYRKPRARTLPILATCLDGRVAVQALQDFCTESTQRLPWSSDSYS